MSHKLCFKIPKSSWPHLTLNSWNFSFESGEAARKYISVHERLTPLAVSLRLALSPVISFLSSSVCYKVTKGQR